MNYKVVNIVTGTVVSGQDYFPFGEIMRSYNNASVNDKYKFTEKERDTETNYDYFGARYYDSEIGRWLNACPTKFRSAERRRVDPLGEIQQGLTPYHYSYNNPLKFTDPTGMIPQFDSADELYNYLTGDSGGGDKIKGVNKEVNDDDPPQNGDEDGKRKNNSKISDEKNIQMSEFSKGIIKNDFTIDARLGQAVEISFKNLNVLNVAFDITQEFPPFNNKSTKIVLFPQQTRTLKYYIFGSVPISWRFNISVFSDVALIEYVIKSTPWVSQRQDKAIK